MISLKAIYYILLFLHGSMDYDEFDTEAFCPQRFNVSRNRWGAVLEMLLDSGYIKGVAVKRSVVGFTVEVERPAITLRGLEYLVGNPLINKAAKAG